VAAVVLVRLPEPRGESGLFDQHDERVDERPPRRREREHPEELPARSLWPRVRAKVDEPSPRFAAADWLLLAALALLCVVQPSSLRMLLFHF